MIKLLRNIFFFEHGSKLPFVSKVQSTCCTSSKKVMELVRFTLNNVHE